jgi:hypothetical protein
MEPPGDLEWVWVRAYSKELQQLQIFFVKKTASFHKIQAKHFDPQKILIKSQINELRRAP